jgi:hypothetical protein
MLASCQESYLIETEKSVTYGVRLDLPILGPIVDIILTRPWDIDDTVDDSMSHMDAAGPEFTRQGLPESAEGKLARGEGSKVCRSPD